MRAYITAFALGAAVLGGGLAAAQPAPPAPKPGAAQPAPPPPGGPGGPGRKMMRMDTNNDGIVTKAEAIAAATAKFDRIDANRDGKLDATEMASMKDRHGPGRGPGRHRGGPDMPPPPPADDNG